MTNALALTELAETTEETADGAGRGQSRADKASDAFRTIGEAAAELGLKTHVLRFWETKFEALSPMKRPDGRRFYRPEDMETLRRIQHLLHVKGLTIRGAIRALEDGNEEPQADDGATDVVDEAVAAPAVSVRDLQDAVRSAVERGDFQIESAVEVSAQATARARLEGLLADLTGLKARVDLVRKAG